MNITMALTIAADAHRGQYDAGGQPYLFHVVRVADKFAGIDSIAQVVALLHDVIEDTNLTMGDLVTAGISTEQADALHALTRQDGERYFSYIDRLALNDIAVAVKLVDLEDNMDAKRMARAQFMDTSSMLRRYKKAHAILTEITEVMEA